MRTTFPKAIKDRIISSLSAHYSHNESENIAYILLEKVLGLNRTGLLLNHEMGFSDENSEFLSLSIKRLLNSEPIQHIIGQTEFYGRKYWVNKHVLIPRQETEELIHLIVNETKGAAPKILDIGTGSGCIACSLAKEIKGSAVSAIDVSAKALEMAQKNSRLLEAEVSFSKIDILHDQIPGNNYDIIVSNPPYVMESEKKLMHQNVIAYDPHLALFVSDDDPLLFYRVILDKSMRTLCSGGRLYFEINEKFGQAVSDAFDKSGYSQVVIHQDLNGKDRFVSGVWAKHSSP